MFKNNVRENAKIKMYKACVSETWVLTQKGINKTQSTEIKFLRCFKSFRYLIK
jgi:hypothetical protein